MNETVKFIVDNWTWLAPLVYEVAVRLFPSEKSLSLINAIKVVADKVVPNIKKEADGTKTRHE